MQKKTRKKQQQKTTLIVVTLNDVRGESRKLILVKHKQVYDNLRALIKISSKCDDTTITLPVEKETLAERVGRIDEIGEMNSEIISVAGGSIKMITRP